VRQNDSILDLAGGKGGDLLKYKESRIGHYVLIDVAGISVEHAVDRYNTMRGGIAFPAKFMAADCWKDGILDKLPPNLQFDIVSIQFALHYSFETEEKAHAMMRNVSSRLKPGGYLIGTIPDAYWIVKKLRSMEGPKFGNSVYSIGFRGDEKKKIFQSSELFTISF